MRSVFYLTRSGGHLCAPAFPTCPCHKRGSRHRLVLDAQHSGPGIYIFRDTKDRGAARGVVERPPTCGNVFPC